MQNDRASGRIGVVHRHPPFGPTLPSHERAVSPTRRLTVLYIAALSMVALLTITGQVFVQVALKTQSSDSRVVNLAGRQRMLSQRLSKASLALVSVDPEARPRYAQELGFVVELWERTHRGLQWGDVKEGLPGANSAEVSRMFASIEGDHQAMLASARALLDSSDLPASSLAATEVLAHERAFVEGMDRIVFQYDKEAKARVTRLKLIELSLLTLTLAILTLEGFFVFRPAVRRVTESVEQLRLSNEQIQRQSEAVEAANRAKSEFLANMSHELRTPMNGVLGMTAILLDTPLSWPQRQYVATIKKSGETLLTLLNDILDFSKIEAGRLEIERVPFSIRAVVDDTMSLFGLSAEQKGLQFRCVVDDNVAEWVSGDPGRLRQVLTNLVGNALKFTSTGEVGLRVHGNNEHQTLRFEVQDTGIGIASETLERLFLPFSQADSSIMRRFGGTGLGLAISKQLVELMGGTFHVESKVGIGSTFSFEVHFPHVVEEHGTEVAKEQQESQGTALQFQGARILVAEDNETNQQVASIMLDHMGCQVRIAGNGVDALSSLALFDFDLVLMDVQMPELDGLKATRRLREQRGRNARIPVIALTAHAMSGFREQCLEAGMNDYLSKPIERDKLAQCLERWLLHRHVQETGPLSDPGALVCFDRAGFVARLGHDEGLFQELLSAFVTQTGQQLEGLMKALESNDMSAMARIAHTLRGASATMSAPIMRDGAGRLEVAAMNGDPQAATVVSGLFRAFEDFQGAVGSAGQGVAPTGQENGAT